MVQGDIDRPLRRQTNIHLWRVEAEYELLLEKQNPNLILLFEYIVRLQVLTRLSEGEVVLQNASYKIA